MVASIYLDDLNNLASEAAEDGLYCSTVVIFWTLKAGHYQTANDSQVHNITWTMAPSQALSSSTCCRLRGLSLSLFMVEESLVNFSFKMYEMMCCPCNIFDGERTTMSIDRTNQEQLVVFLFSVFP